MEGDDQLPPPSPNRTEEEEEEQEEENVQEWMSDNDVINNETGTSTRARFPSETEEVSLPPLPRREEPTLKERLVERERQARVETERARLKRQFALSSNGASHGDHDGGGGVHHRENGSVEGTVGEESSVAAPPTDQGEIDDEDDRKKLGYVMERFLRGDIKEEEEQVEKPTPEPGVLMERFLAEPVVVEQQQDAAIVAADEYHGDDEAKMPADEMTNLPQDNAGEDTDMPLPPPVTSTGPTISRDDSELEAAVGSIRSYSTVTNASLAQVGTLDVDVMEESPVVDETEGSRERSDQSSTDEPRVFRLTEAEIQEMAAIEEASIGNAPPSERDDTFSASSLVGDLVGDLGAPSGLDPAGDFSAGTTTTALESITTAGDGDGLSERSARIEIETQSVDAIESASVSSHLVVSPGASSEGSVSITACPPSVTAEVEPSMLGPDGDPVIALPHNEMEGSAVLEMLSFDQNAPDDTNASLECAPSFEHAGGSLDVEAAAAANAGITNRRSRRGVARMPPEDPETPIADESSEGRKKIQIMLDGFEYDRNEQGDLEATPHSRAMDSYNELPGDDPWSPPGKMMMSPLQPERTFTAGAREAGAPSLPEYPRLEQDVISGEGAHLPAATYGSIQASGQQRVSPPKEVRMSLLDSDPEAGHNETLPLVGKRETEDKMRHDGGSPKHQDLKHALSNVFSSLRSDSTTTVEGVNTDSEQYLAFSILKRGTSIDDVRRLASCLACTHSFLLERHSFSGTILCTSCDSCCRNSSAVNDFWG